MAKYPPNATCPCGSHKKYKKCCASFHKGALPKDALTLMKSRYSAYVVGDSDYIIKTTHRDNPDYTSDTSAWRESIQRFCNDTKFLSLEILSFDDGEREAFVKFIAHLSSGDLTERSRFLKTEGRWLYVDGVFT